MAENESHYGSALCSCTSRPYWCQDCGSHVIDNAKLRVKGLIAQGAPEREMMYGKLTLLSFNLNPSGTNGFKLTMIAPSLRSKNMCVNSRFKLLGNTSLLTS
jgi:hypothetical protein